ncbi:MAG: nuclear transport factor 2 family protein [Bacteroidia bacterium]|nr:nuclear transport factor 2 family protein [Bacteroidia bacterium]
MKNRILFIVLILQTASGFAQNEKIEKYILDLSQRKFEWMLNKNLDSLEVLLDDQVKYIHSNGWAQSKKDVIDDLKSGKLSYQNIKVTESSVRRYDKAAIVNGVGYFSGMVNITSFAMELSYTEVFVYRNGKWLLVSRHANRMP